MCVCVHTLEPTHFSKSPCPDGRRMACDLCRPIWTFWRRAMWSSSTPSASLGSETGRWAGMAGMALKTWGIYRKKSQGGSRNYGNFP